ncbi:MAG: DUF559 domain-containing protein [Planctomycetota bacterium]
MGGDSAEHARRLRHDQTPPEGVLWSHLRNRQLGGLKFRRQHPIGPYVADLFCAEAKLIIEIDGRYHEQRRDQDARRDAWLRQEACEVMRFSALQVSKDTDVILRTILNHSKQRVSSSLSPRGRGPG